MESLGGLNKLSTDIITKITNMKEKLESLDKEKSQEEGNLKSLIARLKKEYKLDSIEEAKQYLRKMENKREQLQEEEEKLISELEEYNWE